MNNAFRMDHDVDARVGDVEQEMRLDNFQTLVHHRRRVDGDLRPHFPARMSERLGDGHAVKRGEGTPQERTAGAGKDETANRFLLLAPQALPDGAVLTVDRK